MHSKCCILFLTGSRCGFRAATKESRFIIEQHKHMDSNKGKEEGVCEISPTRSWVRTLLSVPLGCVKALWLTQWYLFIAVGYVVHFCIAAFKWIHNTIRAMGNHKGREIAPGIYEIERGVHDVDTTYMHKYKKCYSPWSQTTHYIVGVITVILCVYGWLSGFFDGTNFEQQTASSNSFQSNQQ